MSYNRFAVYYMPPEGALADFGATWLGWDAIAGCATHQPALLGLDDITVTPRRYGFHGTLKPPFRLVDGAGPKALVQAVSDMARACVPARCAGLQLTSLSGFLALTPLGDSTGITGVAATCVAELDSFRAAPGSAELARRRKAGLSERQEAMLTRWGYPYVMDDFRFHMTLSGRLSADQITHWTDILAERLPPLPVPFDMDEVALVGERSDGCFELVQRFTLSG